jgi:drug/metabolite transporter (DMT)-like permease
MCAARFSIAGTLMLAYCALTGRRVRFSARQLGHLAAVGILLLMGGNLTLSYAERVVPTGLAALLVAVTPLWFLVLDSLLFGDHHISRRGKIGLAIGIAGVSCSSGPTFSTQFPGPSRTLVVAGLAD